MFELLYLSQLSQNIVYRAEEGDTLRKIAIKFSATPEMLIRLNNLSREPEENEMLFVGSDAFLLYRVKLGDTPESVAARFKTNVAALLFTNGVRYIFPWQLIAVAKRKKTTH